MKAALYSANGDKKEDISLPEIFNIKIREDLALKYFEAEKFSLRQAYSSFSEAGKRHSASGTISHRRHEWKGHYGKGISRVPRKTMHRRGINFYWVGAEVSNARGGRTAHPPKGIYRERKINKKEKTLAISSGFAATINKDYLAKRYSSMKDMKTVSAVIDSFPMKTKEVILTMKKIFGENFEKVFRIKNVRAGKGKMRARKYKSNAGLLVVTGKDEKIKFSGLDIKKTGDLKMRDLYPLGRLTLYTRKALEEMKNAA